MGIVPPSPKTLHQVQHLYDEVRTETSAWIDVVVKAVGDQLFSNSKVCVALTVG